MLGSILPDLDRRMSKIPHEIDAALPLVENIVTNFSNQFCENTIFKRITKSLQMGVICHFISDYFCNAHTSRFKGSIYQHHVYEFRMMWHMKRSKRFVIHKNSIEMNRTKDILAYLERAQVIYMSEQVGFVTDLRHAMGCAVILIESLTMNRQTRQSAFEIVDPGIWNAAVITSELTIQ